MTSETAQAQISLLRHRQFAFYWLTRVLSTTGYQIMQVSIQWEIYQLTGSAVHLGMIGLVMFLPVITGTFIIGHVADHYDRRVVVGICQLTKAIGAILLIVASYAGFLSVPLIYVVVLIISTSRAFESPALNTIPASIMPPEILSRAIAAGASAYQMAQIGGPALGGFLLAAGTNLTYWACLTMFLVAGICISMVQLQRPVRAKKAVTLESVFAGYHYIRSRPIVFGAILLDLVAAVLGGVTALLPIFARDILDAGPEALGLLRSSPAAGALLMSFYLSNIQIDKGAGKTLIASVVIYGLATAVFGFSTVLWVSMLALAVSGAADSVSFVLRQSLVQTRTPNDMLGRVTAVNATFTGTTTSIGQFQSGIMAALIGAGPAAIIGGLGAASAALLWIKLFPDVWRVKSIVPEN